MLGNGLASLMNKPTRITQNNASSLDYTWSNSLENMKLNCGVYHCLCDHLPIIMFTFISKNFPKNVQQCHISQIKIQVYSQEHFL